MSDADVERSDDPDDILYIVERFVGEWNNGGFSQLFANWEPDEVDALPNAMQAIGATAQADVIAAVIAAMGSGEERRDRGHRAIMEFGTGPLSEQFDAFDTAMMPFEDDLLAKIERHELAHSEDAENENGRESGR